MNRVRCSYCGSVNTRIIGVQVKPGYFDAQGQGFPPEFIYRLKCGACTRAGEGHPTITAVLEANGTLPVSKLLEQNQCDLFSLGMGLHQSPRWWARALMGKSSNGLTKATATAGHYLVNQAVADDLRAEETPEAGKYQDIAYRLFDQLPVDLQILVRAHQWKETE